MKFKGWFVIYLIAVMTNSLVLSISGLGVRDWQSYVSAIALALAYVCGRYHEKCIGEENETRD